MTMEESQWLQDVLRYSLKASSYTTADDKPPQADPRLGKLVEGILFSRRFILTYHIIILGIIFSLSVGHWSGKLVRWRRRRAMKLRTFGAEDEYDADAKTITPYSQRDRISVCEVEGVSFSGSSTTQGSEGSASPPRRDLSKDEDEDEDEETPLLHQGNAPHPVYSRRTMISYIRAFLVYQPRPIPFFNKVLPSNGASLAVLAFIGLNIFYMYYHINFNSFETFVWADRFGLLFVANLPYLYILAAKNQPLRLLMGQSYESLNLIHRRLGELLCLEALLHFVGMIATWYQTFRPSGFGFIRFLTLKVTFLGLIALISYEMLYLTSLASFRQRWYELFLGLHIVLQIIGLIFVFLHHSAARPYVGVSLAIFLIDRLVYRIGVKSSTLEARATIMEDDDTVKLSTIITIQRKPRYIFGKPTTAGWLPTDHVFVSIPSLGRKHILQAHPFTIASQAPGPEDEKAVLDLIIRAQGGFSADLLMRARSHKTLSIRLDGPYGSPHARILVESCSTALIIAGGSGIAVAWPLIHHLLDTRRRTDMETAPSSKTLRGKRIVLVWIIHEGDHIDWIGRKALGDVENMGVEILVPRATSEIGRPDLKAIVKETVGKHAVEPKRSIGVLVSGPDGMNRIVRNTCAGMVRDGLDVEIAVEKFGW
ncbi:Ferric/cupric reductase transmembrane component [Lachnellula hyalina]|uniref:Ferric/cupric reductase transmembrane component n=1 Tax=Lachnellula hyalina TaxID=1316788 RepID=A0A8H8RAZ8_9HELO|nr:Ferric/cupric reductase transmembrane component [Lachnellula hyalina]TVY30858.1 Ferric/cupric reductase transmembrane component [Lachnellula hyalina]